MRKTNLVHGIGLAAALSFLALPSVGHADNVIGTTSGSFSDAQPTSYGPNNTPTVFSFNNNQNGNLDGGGPGQSNQTGGTAFVWGTPNTSNDKSNSMIWNAVNSINTTTETPFSLGQLTYTNGTTKETDSDQMVRSVKLTINLDLSQPPGGASGGESFPYTLELITTPNTGTPEENADSVNFASSFTPFRFGGDDGQKYTLQLLGFGNPNEDGGFVDVNGFHIFEGATATTDLYAMVTTNAVPEPASVISMAVAGLAGLGFAARRRRSATRG